MLTLKQALDHGRQVGVRFLVYNSYGAIVAGATTREVAEQLAKKHRREDRHNPWTRGTTQFFVRPCQL